MQKKELITEFLKQWIRTYFTLATLITAATLILGSCLAPEARFGYGAFATPLIYALCGTLPNIVMYTVRDLSAKEFVIRKVIQLTLIEGLVLALALYGGTADIEKQGAFHAIVLGVSILVIFILAHFLLWLQSRSLAKQMTEDLIRFQQNVR